jgi:hypothetical protein
VTTERRPAFGAGLTAVTVLSVVLTAGCGSVSDPGYAAAARNESDTALIVRDGTTSWLLPAHEAGIMFFTIGAPREAPPINYKIVDAGSCRSLVVQRVDFALAPNPGYSQFIVVVEPDLSVHLDLRDTSDPAILESLDPTAACPE